MAFNGQLIAIVFYEIELVKDNLVVSSAIEEHANSKDIVLANAFNWVLHFHITRNGFNSIDIISNALMGNFDLWNARINLVVFSPLRTPCR